MPADRVPPSPEAAELFALTREIVAAELAPRAAAAEESSTFPREIFRLLGRSGLLGLSYPEEYGGGRDRDAVYLQEVEEVATARAGVAEGAAADTSARDPW